MEEAQKRVIALVVIRRFQEQGEARHQFELEATRTTLELLLQAEAAELVEVANLSIKEALAADPMAATALTVEVNKVTVDMALKQEAHAA